MSRTGGPSDGPAALEAARRRVLAALDEDLMTGSAIGRRARELPTDAGNGPREAAHQDESLLYPALYGLVAGWKLRATWMLAADGTRHRVYRRRRMLPRPPWAIKRG